VLWPDAVTGWLLVVVGGLVFNSQRLVLREAVVDRFVSH
jgi:hypothetical protein